MKHGENKVFWPKFSLGFVNLYLVLLGLFLVVGVFVGVTSNSSRAKASGSYRCEFVSDQQLTSIRLPQLVNQVCSSDPTLLRLENNALYVCCYR